jgi:hypothetical protein
MRKNCSSSKAVSPKNTPHFRVAFVWCSLGVCLRFTFGAFLADTADAVKHHGMALKRETVFFSDIMLTLFDFVIGELSHAATMGTYQVIVMITIVELKNGLHPVELTPRQDARLFELREYSVDCGQANLNVFSQKCTVNVFGTQMPVLGAPEDIKHFQSRKGRFKANRF